MYPALLFAGATAAGITVNSVVNLERLSVWLGFGAACVLMFVAAEWRDRRRIVTLSPIARVLAILLMGVAAGGARHATYNQTSPRSVAHLADKTDDDLSIKGRIVDAPEIVPEERRFTIAVDSVFGDHDTTRADGRVRVTLQPSPWANDLRPFPHVQQGDIVQLQGSLQRPPKLRNPGGFNYRSYLERRGICCTFYAARPKHITVTSNDRGPVEEVVTRSRTYIRAALSQYVPSDRGQAVLRALLLGDRSRLTDRQRDQFAKTGLMHLLAVSGLHVFLVGMVFYALLRPILTRFGLRWKVAEIGRAILTIAVLVFYLLLTGARPSVVRAVVMATLFIGGILFQRSTPPLNTLGVAAVVLLAMRPDALFDVGFQLSMTAVAGIITLNPRFLAVVPQRFRDSKSLEWVVTTVTTSAAAILATAPVLLFHFGWVSIAGLLLNVVGIPFTALALAASILMAVVGWLSALAGTTFGVVADLFVWALLATSRYGANWFSWAGLRMPVPDLWVVSALVAALLSLTQWRRPRIRWRWVIVGLIVATISVWGDVLDRSGSPTLDVLFFDVGHGDAVLLSTPKGRHILVDSGPYAPDGGAAEFVILPYLERRGIKYLDRVVVTHPDEDHLGGLPPILRGVSVGGLVRSGQSADTELYNETQRLVQARDVSTRIVQRGNDIEISSTVRVQVLGPPRNASRRGIDSRNGKSVVLHIAYGSVDVLLTGDVEAAAERDLVGAYGGQLDSRVVKVPHHGSPTSSTTEFVRTVGSGIAGGHAVVTVGRWNQYGLPSDRVLQRWSTHGLNVHSTARNGAVWVRTDGDEVWTVNWK